MRLGDCFRRTTGHFREKNSSAAEQALSVLVDDNREINRFIQDINVDLARHTSSISVDKVHLAVEVIQDTFK